MTIMIIQFVKDDGLPVVCVATNTCRYDTERSRRVKQFVSYGFVYCQENESYFTSVFTKVQFWHAWLPTDLDRKSLYILQTESQSMNSFFKKMENYFLPHDDQLLLTHLVAQT